MSELQERIVALQNRQLVLVTRYGSLAQTLKDTVVELMNITKDLTKAECLLENESNTQADLSESKEKTTE